MKVLFISPLDPSTPKSLKNLVGGENTYTKTLLMNPPVGVKYFHYTQAFREKKIVYTPWQSRISFLMKARFLPPDAGFQCLRIEGEFDLIHCHAYSLKLENYSGPVVLSDSSSNYCFLKDYLGWGKSRIELGYKFRKWVDLQFNLYDPTLNLNKAKKLIVWSEYAKKIHLELGADQRKIMVIPPGIEKLPGRKIEHGDFTILFVGTWFARKGGQLILKAYCYLKQKYPKLKLLLISQLPKGEKLPSGVLHYDFLPRERLVREIFPQADVLVLVPPVVEGYGLVILEAASLGIPAIVSSVYALPEIVENKITGLVIPPGNLEVLIEQLERLINNPELLKEMSKRAKEKFEKEFYIKETNKKLLKVYQEVTCS